MCFFFAAYFFSYHAILRIEVFYEASEGLLKKEEYNLKIFNRKLILIEVTLRFKSSRFDLKQEILNFV